MELLGPIGAPGKKRIAFRGWIIVRGVRIGAFDRRSGLREDTNCVDKFDMFIFWKAPGKTIGQHSGRMYIGDSDDLTGH